MKRMCKLTALVVVLAMALIMVAACGTPAPATPANGAATTTPAAPQIPTTPTGDEPALAPPPEAPEDGNFASHVDIIMDNNMIGVVNPLNAGATGSTSRWAFRMIYDRLVYAPPGGGFEPMLATSWDTDDYKTFIFHLRDDVTFHNGEPFTAQDVVDTIYLAHVERAGLAWQAWSVVETATVIDTHTVELVLTGVNVEFLFNAAMPGAGILHKASVDADAERGTWVGTGAFQITNFASNDFVEFARNDNYWGDTPISETMTFRFIPEMAARTIMMLNNEAQVVGVVSPEDRDMFVEDPNFNLVPMRGNATMFLGFNMNDPIAGDINFRRAIAHALYLPHLAIAAGGNWSVAAPDGAYWGPVTEFRNESLPIRERDLDLAMQYLEASVWDGEEVSVSLSIATIGRAMEMAQAQLSEIGVPLFINIMDSASFGAHATYENNEAQMMSHAGSFAPNASSIRPHLMPHGTLNRASFNNDEVTELLERANTVTNVSERAEIYMQVQAIVHEYIPYINMYENIGGLITTAGVGGVIVTFDGCLDFRFTFLDLDA